MMELPRNSVYLKEHVYTNDYRLKMEALDKVFIKTKFVESSLSAIISILIYIFNLLPAPYRNKYLYKRIHVSIGSLGENHFQIKVYRKSKSKTSIKKSNLGTKSLLTSKIEDTENVEEAYRIAAFMILELHNTAFPGLKWQGISYFTEGLDHLDQYKQHPDSEIYKKIKKDFTNAIKADPNEIEARYFLGLILLSERKAEPIDQAIKHFNKALNTNRLKLEALVHAGLSQCYIQQYHRLGMRKSNVLEKAKEQAKLAKSIWEENESQSSPKPNSWIQYTLALTMVVDEGNAKTPEKIKEQFIPAINLCYKAIQSNKEHNLFNNALGWMLIKLSENNIIEFETNDDILEDLQGNIPSLAEKYLNKALSSDKNNKLSNANLCLLYATPYFLSTPESNLIKCRYFGERAIQIDPDYINGYRDLAVSLIKYEIYEEAYKYYLKALEKAVYPTKDLEIIKDILEVLNEKKAPLYWIEKFRNPPEDLLRPLEEN